MAQYVVLTEFDNKIEEMKYHEKYRWLKAQADKAKQMFDSFGLDRIRGEDFIERIAAMPLDYISDWLDGKNQLFWRPEDKKMLSAIKCGGKRVLMEHPDAEDVCQIRLRSEEAYIRHGYLVGERGPDYLIVYKM